MTIEIHENDTLEILVTVIDKTTSLAKDISGATITAVAANIRGSTLTAVTAITSAVDGEFTATFAADIFTIGQWTFQARAVIGSEDQIVSDELIQVVPAYL